MKTNTKAKKAPATKAKAPVKSVKTTVKAKSPVKSNSKPVAKVAAKAAAKTVAKKSVVKVTAKAVTKKSAAPAVAKKAVKAAVKAVKPVAKAVKAAKTPAKAVKVAAKAVKSAPIKAVKAVKPVVEVKKAAVKASPVKNTAKAAPKAVVASASKPIVVKMPENQNTPVRTVYTAMMSSVRPTPTVVNKMSDSSSSTPRAVYRPIQVINKPLAPVQPARQMAPVAKVDEKIEFKKGDYVVYPAHGVGEIEAVETQIIGGMEIKLYAIAFEKDRMRLKVPVFKAHASGLRRLSTTNRMQDALKTLQGRAQVRRAMWSRRAQEYETKINSGDPVSIAEVLRDLKRSNDESEQSYSERQIYQSALERLAREVAAVEKISEIEAAERLETMIRGKRARAAAADDVVVKEAANA